MTAYLKIENPGVAPTESFTLMGASTKRNSDNGAVIGNFGTGNKQSINVLLRERIYPIIFTDKLRMDFQTREQQVNDGLRFTEFNRIVVKFSGKDQYGSSKNSTEDLGWVLEHGASDWTEPELALREFISNALDRAVEQGEFEFIKNFFSNKNELFLQEIKNKCGAGYIETSKKLEEYRKNARDFQNVVIEIVNENQVRAKAGTTRIFVPLTPKVYEFYNNVDKWFLHFKEPELLNCTILPKSNRNLGERKTAVIYRRGVRVREFQMSDTPSLFDYNLNNLKMDECRKVDDWYVQYEAAQALAAGTKQQIGQVWQSFLDQGQCWEHSFQSYGLEHGIYNEEQKKVWSEAFRDIAGENAVLSTDTGGLTAARKGYRVVVAPEAFVKAAQARGIATPATVLTDDEKEGREIFDSTPDAVAAVEFAWELIEKNGMTNGCKKPEVKTFRMSMSAGTQVLGYYRDNVVYINQDIAGNSALSLGWHGLTVQLLTTAVEETIHHVTKSNEWSKDIENFAFNLIVHMGRKQFELQ